jgi:ATP-binding cassette subfamily C (CFTR/MRP) protein 1
MNIRTKEMSVLGKTAYLHAATSFVWATAPFLVALVTFASFVLIDENNVLSPEKAFVSLALFNIIKMPMTVFPMMVVACVGMCIFLKFIRMLTIC